MSVSSSGTGPVVVARVHEVALKGRNRPWFMRMLLRNIRVACQGLSYQEPRVRSGRILIPLDDLDVWPAMRERLSRVFGIANFSLTLGGGTDLDDIRRTVVQVLEVEGPPVGAYRVRVKRADKSYPLTSPEIEREIGALIKERTGAPVNLQHPDTRYRIELLHHAAHVSASQVAGAGGLPVGVSGRVVLLMSGGFDSPVAAWRMMKRGCELTLVHCHAYPFVRSASIEKVIELAQHLGRSQPGLQLSFVPIGQAQRQIAIATAAEPEIRVVLYRRLMMRIAGAIANEQDAGAIATGESLGQVASQTLENLRAISAVAELPVLRPLIGHDKDEILNEATNLGTEPISRVPDDDCCTVFVPKHPTTHATAEQAEAAEEPLDIPALVAGCLAARVEYRDDPAGWDVTRAIQRGA